MNFTPKEYIPKELDYYVEGDFPCSIWRNKMGVLCGYIGVPRGHPWYGEEYSEINAHVHGGITYTEHELYGHPNTVTRLQDRVEHASDGVMRDFYQRHLDRELDHQGDSREFPHVTGLDIWWLGFDCGHAYDYIPALSMIPNITTKECFRDEEYVRKEITSLVSQAAKAYTERLDEASVLEGVEAILHEPS